MQSIFPHPNRPQRYAPGRPGFAPKLNPQTSPYFNPRHGYGSPYGKQRAGSPKAFGKTEIGRRLFENNPEAAYGVTTARRGLPQGSDPFSQFVQGEYANHYRGYQQAMQSNPFLSWKKYLRGSVNPTTMRARFADQSPMLRGVDAANYGAGPTRTLAF